MLSEFILVVLLNISFMIVQESLIHREQPHIVKAQTRDGNPSNFWTGFGFLPRIRPKKWRIPADSRFLFLADFGFNFRIIAIF